MHCIENSSEPWVAKTSDSHTGLFLFVWCFDVASHTSGFKFHDKVLCSDTLKVLSSLDLGALRSDLGEKKQHNSSKSWDILHERR